MNWHQKDWWVQATVAAGLVLASATCGRTSGRGPENGAEGVSMGGTDSGQGASGEPAAALGGSDGDAVGGAAGQGSEAAEPSLQEALQQMLEATCERRERCGSSFEYEQIPGGCEAAYRSEWQAAVESTTEFTTRGTFVYNASRAETCAEARRQAACDDPHGEFPAPCHAAFEGIVEVGGLCSNTLECVGDAVCSGCPGRCLARSEIGRPCLKVPCQTGLTCVDDVCVAQASEGEQCAPAAGVYCSGVVPCVVNQATGEARCTSLRTASSGEACARDEGLLCEPGSACVRVPDGGHSPRSCQPRSKSGARCWTGEQDSCPVGEYCPIGAAEHAQSVFVSKCLPLARIGERCYGPRGCEVDSQCLQGLCVANKHQGEACRSSAECAYGICAGGHCAVDDVCVAEDADPGLLRDPVPPPQACPTESPGELLDGFDSDTLQYWRTNQDDGVRERSWSPEGYRCRGSLHHRVQLSEGAPLFELERPQALPVGNAHQRLHVWLRVFSSDMVPMQGSIGVEAHVTTPAGRLRRWVDVSALRDGEWHELVVALSLESAIESVGVALWMYDEPMTWSVPELDLFIDDVWLE